MSASQNHTTKKTTAPRGDKPAPVSVNFDSWARDEAVEPFAVVIGGKRYVSLDPLDLDYREISAALDASPEDAFRLLFPDDAEEMVKNKISVGAMAAFNEAIVTHFGLQDFIAAQS